ncbi:MAG: hypothetical protein QOC82_1834 [Frankiaceae bacterium]|jgi:hypothetical protein|nr:hypothetical protein [Frankiaceae bacterium]
MRKTQATAVAAALCFAMPSAQATTVPELSACSNLVLSPNFTADQTAFCAGVDPNGGTSGALRLYTTRNGGKSWTSLAPTGVTVTSPLPLRDFLVSPDFVTDHLLVLQLSSSELFYSRDGGSTFTELPIAAALGAARVALVPATVSSLPMPSAVSLAHADILVANPGPAAGGTGSYLFDPVALSWQPIVGTSDADQAFFVSPTYAADQVAFAAGVASGGSASSAHADLFACDTTFRCGTKLASLPNGYSWVDQVRLASDYSHSGTIVLTAAKSSNRYDVFVSHDRGRTFSVAAPIQKALTALYRAGTQPSIAVASGSPGSRILFVRLSGGVAAANPPSEQLFRSSDDGRTWSVAAYGRTPFAHGSRGTMPYGYLHTGRWGSVTPAGTLTSAGQRLLMTADWWPTIRANPFVTVWCSTTDGRTWATSCR